MRRVERRRIKGQAGGGVRREAVRERERHCAACVGAVLGHRDPERRARADGERIEHPLVVQRHRVIARRQHSRVRRARH